MSEFGEILKPLQPFGSMPLYERAVREVAQTYNREGRKAAELRVTAIADAFIDFALDRKMKERVSA